jgi:hypothetical protein
MSTFSAAFSSGRKQSGFAERRQYAAEQASAKRLEVEKEKKKLAELSDLTSEKHYPALGTSGGKMTFKPVLNFKKTVEEMAVREAEKEAAATTAMKEAVEKAAASQRRTVVAPMRQFAKKPPVDLLDELLGDEEEELQAYESESDEEEDDGEFNAELYSDRRRGDKGIW